MRIVFLFLTVACVATLTMPAQAGTLSFTQADAKVAYETAEGLVKNCTPRNAGTPGAIKAAIWLSMCAGASSELDRFRDNIYDETCEFANVLLEVRGTNPNAPWIVLMSHFDTAPKVARGFEGANDGASTSGLLVAIGKVLRRAPSLKYNVLLAWTDAEECRIAYMPRDGFQGSKRLVKYVREKGYDVKAAICLDMLGDKDLNIEIPSNSTPHLRRLTLESARRVGIADKVEYNGSVIIKDDHTAFLNAGYPAIDIIDFDYGSVRGRNDYWHTPKDTLDKISAESLLASGRLACELLNLLNQD